MMISREGSGGGAPLLRGRSQAPKLDNDVGKAEVVVRLPPDLAQGSHAARPLAVAGAPR
jgi:hypothetical protein